MKSVLISTQPRWCKLIASGKKTIEVRKTKPKIEVPFKAYISCTSSNVHECLMQNESGVKLIYAINYKTAIPCVGHIANGKVVGEFVCDKVYDIKPHFDKPDFCNQYLCDWNWGEGTACLSFTEMNDYLNGKNGYGWHISDLVIYDKPKELSEFATVCEGLKPCQCDECEYLYTESNESIGVYHECCCNNLKPLKRPPQSWCYVEERSRP